MFKDIKGFEGLYQVDENGIVISLRTSKRKKVKRGLNKQKRMFVQMTMDNANNSYYVDKLVADAFLPNPKNKTEVEYIDGNPLNVHVSNLKWK